MDFLEKKRQNFGSGQRYKSKMKEAFRKEIVLYIIGGAHLYTDKVSTSPYS